MNEDKKIVDLVGEAGDQTASGVEVIFHIHNLKMYILKTKTALQYGPR